MHRTPARNGGLGLREASVPGLLRRVTGVTGAMGRPCLRPVPVAPVLALLLFLPGCSEEEPLAPVEPVTLTFDFGEGLHEWRGGFADYPAGQEGTYGFLWSYGPVPRGVEGRTRGILMGANNHSDDLFMYLKRRVDGLLPGREYAVRLTVTFATREGAGCVGIGGAPGESVYVKAGAAAVEPVAEVDDQGWYRLNVDKGNQARGGRNARVIGDVAHPDLSCDGSGWAVKTLTMADSQAVVVRADSGGRLWLLGGTDSGYEGNTTLVYLAVEAVLEAG